MTTNNHVYKITITELEGTAGDFEAAVPIYEQVVPQLDLSAVIMAVNSMPITKIRAPRSDKGKKRVEAETQAPA